MKRFIIAAWALFSGMLAFAQFDPDMPLPMNPDLRIGKLENGLTYYIQHNEEPKERADFYIIYKVGALQENDNQNGLAHFLEHMAFNGTKNFPGGNSESSSIVKTLERHGVAFGRNINAYTSLDRTVYYMNDVNVNDKPLVDTCLLVLHDWAHYVTLDGQEIDNERGVISEEWRTRNNSAARMRKQWFPVIFGDTPYTTHDVIGSYEIINNFKYDELRDFYYQWYRTDMQAVAVVGDINVDEIEAKIKAMFSHIPAVENPTPKAKISLPTNEEPLYALATDPEQANTEVEIIMTHDRTIPQTVGGQRTKTIQNLYSVMLKQRLADIVTNGDPALSSGSAGISEFIPGTEAYSISSTAKNGKDLEGFQRVYTEVVRAQRFGFTEGELKRVKLDVLSGLENQYKQKDKTKNSTIAGQIVSVFAYDKVVMNMDFNYQLVHYILDSISLKDINDFAATVPDFKNVRVVVMAKEDPQAHYPTKEEVLGVVAKVNADKSITALEDKEFGSFLMDREVAPGRIVKEKALPVFGAKEWKLSNGAKVVYAKADHNKDAVSLSSNSYGGSSLYPVSELIDVFAVSATPSYCGSGKFSATDLKKVLAGKKVDVGVSVKGETESISGTSTTKDFETMMQLAYLRMAEPRFDSTGFYSGIANLKNLLKMFASRPETVVGDSLGKILTNYHPRTLSLTPESLDEVDLAVVEKIYRERFGNASDFTFFIVGDVDEDVVKPAVEKYIASLPATGKKDRFIDHKEYMPKGRTVRRVVIPFKTPKANVNLVYSQFAKIDSKVMLQMSVLREVMNMRFITNIREKEGGTYGVKVQFSGKRLPKKNITCNISFDTDITKANRLHDLVLVEIDNICKEGMTEAELDNIRKNLLKNREQAKTNNQWVEKNLRDYVLYGEDNANPKNYEDILNALTTEDIRKFAVQFFGKADVVDVIFANEFAE